jgi:hypothetical protein
MNFQEIEESLSLPELELIVTAAREEKMREQKFMAALKGINLDGDQTVDLVEQKKRELEARNAGVNVDTLDFIDMGIDVVSE